MKLRVKMLTKAANRDMRGFFGPFLPAGLPVVGDCLFIFNREERNYDWLVVVDDLPSRSGERFTLWEEVIPGNPTNTLLLTLEPSTIKAYGKDFMRQFGHVLSSQEPFAIQHPGHIHSHASLPWFYGKTYDETAANFPSNKTSLISTVCSSKKQKHTLHALRHRFTQILKQELPELEVYGHGHRQIETKVTALDPFRYHLVAENHLAVHHWTEKLADAFLGGCFPIYFGAPNIYDYFPEDSLLRVDLRDTQSALAQINELLQSHSYGHALPAIREARRRVIEEYALFPRLSQLLPTLHQAEAIKRRREHSILSRHAWRRKHPMRAVWYGFERVAVRYRGQHAARRITLEKG